MKSSFTSGFLPALFQLLLRRTGIARVLFAPLIVCTLSANAAAALSFAGSIAPRNNIDSVYFDQRTVVLSLTEGSVRMTLDRKNPGVATIAATNEIQFRATSGPNWTAYATYEFAGKLSKSATRITGKVENGPPGDIWSRATFDLNLGAGGSWTGTMKLEQSYVLNVDGTHLSAEFWMVKTLPITLAPEPGSSNYELWVKRIDDWVADSRALANKRDDVRSVLERAKEAYQRIREEMPPAFNSAYRIYRNPSDPAEATIVTHRDYDFLEWKERIHTYWELYEIAKTGWEGIEVLAKDANPDLFYVKALGTAKGLPTSVPDLFVWWSNLVLEANLGFRPIAECRQEAASYNSSRATLLANLRNMRARLGRLETQLKLITIGLRFGMTLLAHGIADDTELTPDERTSLRTYLLIRALELGVP